MADDLRDLVRAERRLQGLSVRAAAASGGCSNTTWSAWENGGDLGPAVRRCVIKALGWPDDWPENPPASRLRPAEPDEPTNAQLLQVLEGLTIAVDDTQWMLRQIAKSRGIPLRARSKRGPSPHALNAGRRKADRP